MDGLTQKDRSGISGLRSSWVHSAGDKWGSFRTVIVHNLVASHFLEK